MSSQIVYLDVDAIIGFSEESEGVSNITGRLYIQVFHSDSSQLAKTFLSLAAENAFKDTTFRRLVKDFVLQGGITKGDIFHPKLLTESETCSEKEDNVFEHSGVVAYAAPIRDSDPSLEFPGFEFFITLKHTAELEGKFAVIGKVVQGMEVVRKIAKMCSVDFQEKPISSELRIAASGVLASEAELPVIDPEDPYPEFLEDADDKIRFVSEKIEAAAKIREAGNAKYKAKMFQAAIDKYDKAIRYLFEEFPSPKEEADLEEQKRVVMLNRAAARLALAEIESKHENASAAIEDCNLVLAADRKNIKALTRKALGKCLQEEWESAKDLFQEVLQLDPKNATASAKLKVCKAKIAEQTEYLRKSFGGVFRKEK